ncbi:MAG: Usg family protein [Oceanicaulis sp.]
MRTDPDFLTALTGARLTTAQVYYHLPDHPGLLQTFLWQTYDQAPDFPRLMGFLDFWRREIEAVIHSVRVAHAELIKPAEWRGADVELRLN